MIESSANSSLFQKADYCLQLQQTLAVYVLAAGVMIQLFMSVSVYKLFFKDTYICVRNDSDL